jgi:hypothetical protein
LLAAIEQEAAIPAQANAMFALSGEEIARVDARVEQLEAELAAAHKVNPVSQRLATIPGIGPVTGLTLAIGIDPSAFASGRHLAAVALAKMARIAWAIMTSGGGFALGGSGRDTAASSALHGIVVEPLGPAAEAVALQRRDDQPLALDLGKCRAQHLLQGGRIIGQCGRDGEHPETLNRRYESGPLNLA